MGLLPFPAPKESVEYTIRQIVLQDTGRFFITDHARMRMLEREITDKHLLICIKEGELVSGPTLDKQHELGWTCVFSRICAGASLRVCCKLVQRDEETLLVLTAFWRE